MTATTDVPDLVESWAAAEQGSDVEALDRLLAGDFVGVGLVGFVLGRDQWLARFGNGLENRGTAASRRAHPTRAAETERHPEDENEVRGTMEGFDPFDSFGLEVASSYDEDLRGDEAETVEFLAEHAGTGPVLEFAIGTGRIALPLSERGIRVDGIEQSTAMVDQLRAKPGADKISITIGDMSAVELPEQYTLVYLVFNTIHNLLTQDGQVRCFENAARHLDSDGVFVVETGVPWRGPREGSYIEVPKVTMGEVRISPHTYDAMTQILDISHLRLTTEGIQMSPLSLRLVYPSELDLMARIAGLRLRHRWGGWKQETFTVHSRRHVSVYERR